MMYPKIVQKIKSNPLVLGFVVLGFISYLSTRESAPPAIENDTLLPAPRSVDTFIPVGLTLVPIEIANAESLASLVGEQGGVVDLYLASNDKQKGGLKVGSRLKLLRAPLNPQQYAVLVKDGEGSKLLSFAGPFIAVVQNPNTKGSELTSTERSHVRVEYQN